MFYVDVHIAQINLIFAWLLIVIGIIFGFILGLNFHLDDWWGGYTSFRRRLYRLAHVSFFGLAILNLLFYFTATWINNKNDLITIASWGFVIGGITMPFCCLMTAHNTRFRTMFALPVGSLIIAAVLTFWEVIGL